MSKIFGTIITSFLLLTVIGSLQSKEKNINEKIKEKRPVEILWKSQDKNIVFKFKYDKNNNIVQLDNYVDGKLDHYIVNEFGPDGNIAKEIKYDKDKKFMGYKSSTYDGTRVIESKFFNTEKKLDRVVRFDYEKDKWVKTIYLNDNDREVASIVNKFEKDLIVEMVYEVRIADKVYQRPVNLSYEDNRLVNFKSNKGDDGSFLEVKISYEDGKVARQSYEWMIVCICVN